MVHVDDICHIEMKHEYKFSWEHLLPTKASGFVFRYILFNNRKGKKISEEIINLFEMMKIPIFGVIENMSFYQDALTGEKHKIFGEGGGREVAQKFSIPLLGQVPIDPLLMDSLDQGEGAKFSLSQEVLWKIAVEISKKL